jgi:hypothetical protein
MGLPAVFAGVTVGLTEDAHSAGADQQPDDDENDAPEELPAEQRKNAGHDEYHGQNPENEVHK